MYYFGYLDFKLITRPVKRKLKESEKKLSEIKQLTYLLEYNYASL